MGRVTTRVPVRKIRYAEATLPRPRADIVAVEEPLEVRAGGRVLTVTMRTPGADIDLVHGWLLAEGLIRTGADLRAARYCAGSASPSSTGPTPNTYNVLDVDFAPDAPARESGALDAALRLGMTTSACGVCGSASIEALRGKLPPAVLAAARMPISPAHVAAWVEVLRAQQPTFAATGGTHAAALFGADGALRAAAEDVGRHNAVDTVSGALVRHGCIPPLGGALVVSSRASYEIVQKAAMAGVPMVVAVSAPSSLAVAAATEMGMTLLAFARADGVNVYA